MIERKHLAIIIALLLSCASVWSESYKLRIKLKDGSQEEMELRYKPVITFSDGNLKISTDSYTCALADIETFRFYDSQDVATEINTGKTAARYVIDGNTMTIYGVEEDIRTSVYDMSGRRQNATVTHEADITRIDLGGLPGGLYIIQAGNRTLKINKR